MALDGGAVKKMTLVSRDGVSFEVDEAAVAAEFEKMTLESGAVKVKKMTLVSRDGVSFEVDVAALASEFEKMALESGAVKVKKMKLVSRDGVSFEVDKAVATKFQFNRLMKADFPPNQILLPTVKSHILAKVLEYCKKHVQSGADVEELKTWDAEFVAVDQITLYRLMTAATDMKIYPLGILVSKTVAGLIKGKSREQIWELCGLSSEKLTPQVKESLIMAEEVITDGVVRTLLKRYL